MIKRQDGFSLVELLIAMVMFVLVIAAASSVFTSLLTQFKQQGKITETNIEGIVGLDILRRDIEHAGYGLPWDLALINYSEADDYGATPQDERWYNDSALNAPPRALVSGNGDGDGTQGAPGSDVLVIKSLIVATSEASQKWTHVNKNNIVSEWDPQRERLETSDRVIVMAPGKVRTLINNGAGGFTTRYDANPDPTPDSLFDTEFLPVDAEKTYVVYGVTKKANPVATLLRMPFNRADYYVRTPNTPPKRCATKTDGTGIGILYKGTLNQGDGQTVGGGLNELPLIDCVADMQVIYGVDNDEDGDFEPGTDDGYYADFSGILTTAEDVRRVKQVRVYVLAHEGQRDLDFTFTRVGPTFYPGACATCIRVGPNTGEGRDFNFVTQIGTVADTHWDNYRWKVYTLVVKVEN